MKTNFPKNYESLDNLDFYMDTDDFETEGYTVPFLIRHFSIRWK